MEYACNNIYKIFSTVSGTSETSMIAVTFTDEGLGKDCATWDNEAPRNKDMDSQKPRNDQPADMTSFSDQVRKFSQELDARVY